MLDLNSGHGASWRSAERARGQPGDDAALGEQDEQGDGDRDDDHRRVDQVVEGLVLALAEGGDGQRGGEVSWLARNETANAKSFQARMKARIAAVNTPGMATGMTTLRSVCSRVAPSMSAASSRSFGYLLEEVLQQPGGDRQRVDQVDDDQRVDVVQRARWT